MFLKYRISTAAIFILILALLEATSCSLPELPESETDSTVKKILFIGHSYTKYNDLPRKFELLTLKSGQDTVFFVGDMAKNGHSLKMHYFSGEAEAEILKYEWDYVVLQGATFDGPEKYSFAAYFHALVQSIGAETLLFLPWTTEGYGDYQPEYNTAYNDLGEYLEAEVVPVGPAWQKILEENPDIDLYLSDESHPTALGTYVAACVFYSYLYNKSPEGLPYSFATIAEQEEIDLIQRVVWETVQEYEQ